jgi:non-specific serine/threonine protein kinase
MRCRMLETLREYGREQLAEQEEEALARRHVDYYRALAEEAKPHLQAGEQARWLERLETEHDNLRAALQWCCAAATGSGDGGAAAAEEGLRLATALYPFWQVRGHLAEGLDWLRRLLAHNEGSASALRADALNSAGMAAFFAGDFATTRACVEESLALYRRLGDVAGATRALTHLADLHSIRGEYPAARALLEEGLDVTPGGDTPEKQEILESLARTALYARDYASARAFADEWLDLARRGKDRRTAAAAQAWQGYIAANQGEYKRASRLFHEALRVSRELGETLYAGATLAALGALALLAGNYEEARSLETQALVTLRNSGYEWVQAMVLEIFCYLDAAENRPERAARLFGVTQAFRRAVGVAQADVLHFDRDAYVDRARHALGAHAFAAAQAAGARMTLAEAIEEALTADRAASGPDPIQKPQAPSRKV